MTSTTNTLAGQIVKGVRGVTTTDRPSHARIESADGRQIAFLVGKKLHTPSGMAVPAAKALRISGGRHVLVVTDDNLDAARGLVAAIDKAYRARRAAKAKGGAKATEAAPAKPAARTTPEAKKDA
jgi:hypothetical protein